MNPLENFLAALRERGYEPRKSGEGWQCRCPAHDDRNPSLSINPGDDGGVVWRCHAGCEQEAVIAAVGLTFRDVMPDDPSRRNGDARNSRQRGDKTPRNPARGGGSVTVANGTTDARTFPTANEALAELKRRHGQPSGLWTYRNAAGEPVGLVVRWEIPADPKDPASEPGKEIQPVSRFSNGWANKGMPTPRPLYRLPELLATPAGSRVWIFEGERCADTAAGLGLVAMTSVHGARAAASSDWSTLAGHDLVISVDHDNAGEDYGAKVAQRCLAAGAKSVRIVRLVELWADMPEGGDIVDYLNHRGGDADAARAEVEALADKSPEVAQNSFQSLRDSGGRNESALYTLVSIADLGPAQEPDWLWPGYLARGGLTLLTGLWKAGKTTLMGYLLRDLYRGDGLVTSPIDAPTIYLSEEPTTLWASRRDRLGLPKSILFLQRQAFVRPRMDQWCEMIAKLAKDVRGLEAGFVVIDTLPSAWPVLNENDAGEVMQAMSPLRELTEANAAVLLIHHPRKGDGNEATATRGSGALPGFVDVIVELRRSNPSDEGDRRRLLKAYGRFESTPPEQVIELGDDGYRLLGDRPAVHNGDRLDAIKAILPVSAPGLTFDELWNVWPTNPKPGKTALRTAANRGSVDGQWCRNGSGTKGDPHRYLQNPPSENAFQSPPHLSERNESESVGEWGEVA